MPTVARESAREETTWESRSVDDDRASRLPTGDAHAVRKAEAGGETQVKKNWDPWPPALAQVPAGTSTSCGHDGCVIVKVATPGDTAGTEQRSLQDPYPNCRYFL